MTARRAARWALARSALAIGVIGLGGCTWLAGFVLPGVDACETPLVPVAELGPDRMMRERVRVRAGEIDARYELIVVKRGEELSIVAFTGLGAQAFRATQRGTELEIEDRMGPASPVPPGTLVAELHRARFAASHPPTVLGEPLELEPAPGCGHRSVWVRIDERPLASESAP